MEKELLQIHEEWLKSLNEQRDTVLKKISQVEFIINLLKKS